jgi:hypothetical protein
MSTLDRPVSTTGEQVNREQYLDFTLCLDALMNDLTDRHSCSSTAERMLADTVAVILDDYSSENARPEDLMVTHWDDRYKRFALEGNEDQPPLELAAESNGMNWLITVRIGDSIRQENLYIRA